MLTDREGGKGVKIGGDACYVRVPDRRKWCIVNLIFSCPYWTTNNLLASSLMAVETFIRAAIRHRAANIAFMADLHLLYMYIDDRANLLLAMYNALLRTTYSDTNDRFS